MSEHIIGLLLGTEEDWPAAFEELVRRLGPVDYRGVRHTFSVERVTNEPFDRRSRPRHEVAIDRLGWWYERPRAWVKRSSRMGDVRRVSNRSKLREGGRKW